MVNLQTQASHRLKWQVLGCGSSQSVLQHRHTNFNKRKTHTVMLHWDPQINKKCNSDNFNMNSSASLFVYSENGLWYKGSESSNIYVN